jgi:FkbM family methyltransferase
MAEIRWEADFAQERWPLMVGALGHLLLSVRPRTHRRAYYSAIGAGIAASVRRRAPEPLERYVTDELWVKFRGMEYLLTRDSLFGYFLHSFEPRTARDLLRRTGDVFIDAGANTGQYSVPMARRFGTVVAIEPNPVAAAILRRNLERNRLSNVRVLERLLSPTTGVRRLYAGATLTTWGTHDVADKFVDVPSIRLDDVLAGFDHVDLLKLDIEGMEAEVLLDSLLLDRVAAISFSGFPADVERVRSPLRALGFSVRTPEPLFRSVENFVAERR